MTRFRTMLGALAALPLIWATYLPTEAAAQEEEGILEGGGGFYSEGFYEDGLYDDDYTDNWYYDEYDWGLDDDGVGGAGGVGLTGDYGDDWTSYSAYDGYYDDDYSDDWYFDSYDDVGDEGLFDI